MSTEGHPPGAPLLLRRRVFSIASELDL